MEITLFVRGKGGGMRTEFNLRHCTIYSKINGTPKGVYMHISKQRSILRVANLPAHNNLWLCYYAHHNITKSHYVQVN